MMKAQATPPKKGVFDLVDAIEKEQNGHSSLSSKQKVYDLVDTVAESSPTPPPATVSKEDIMNQVTVIAEKMARELFPGIAERIIREEIAKLKTEENDS
jgi:hypothetical protein